MATQSRKLKFFERYYVCRNVEHYYNNFNVIARYNLHVENVGLSQVLANMIKKNIWLAYSIFKDNDLDSARANGSDWDLHLVDHIRFEDVVTYQTIKTFDKSVFSYLHNLRCELNLSDKPLWRIIVFEPEDEPGAQYVCLYFDHVLYDGSSGLEFHKDIVKEYSRIDASGETPEFQEYLFDIRRDAAYAPPKPIPASTDQIDIYSPQVLSTISVLITLFLPRALKFFSYYSRFFRGKDLTFWPNLRKNPVFLNSTGIRSIESRYEMVSLTPDEVDVVSKFCKQNGLAITSYIHTIALQCLEEEYFAKVDSTTKYSTTSLVPINGRRYFPKGTPFRYGVFVSGEMMTLPPVLNRTLAFMKAIQDRIDNSVKTGYQFRFVGLLRLLNVWKFLKDQISPEGRVTFEISNLGRVPPTNDKYKIIDVHFSQSLGIMSSNIINSVSTIEGGLNMTFVYLPKVDLLYDNDVKVVDLFLQRFKEMLVDFATPHLDGDTTLEPTSSESSK